MESETVLVPRKCTPEIAELLIRATATHPKHLDLMRSAWDLVISQIDHMQRARAGESP